MIVNAKNQKGITLISVSIYVIVMLVVVGVLSIVGDFFFSNIKSVNKVVNPLTEYTKFNSFFTDEVNYENIRILECGNDYIVFDNGVQYTFIQENRGIYRNQVKICNQVDSCRFSYTIENGKDKIEVNMQIGGKNRVTNYTLKK